MLSVLEIATENCGFQLRIANSTGTMGQQCLLVLALVDEKLEGLFQGVAKGRVGGKGLAEDGVQGGLHAQQRHHHLLVLQQHKSAYISTEFHFLVSNKASVKALGTLQAVLGSTSLTFQLIIHCVKEGKFEGPWQAKSCSGRF